MRAQLGAHFRERAMKSLLNSGLKANSVVSWEIGERQVQQTHGGGAGWHAGGMEV